MVVDLAKYRDENAEYYGQSSLAAVAADLHERSGAAAAGVPLDQFARHNGFDGQLAAEAQPKPAGYGLPGTPTIGDFARSVGVGLDQFGQVLGRGMQWTGLERAGKAVEGIYKDRETATRGEQTEAYKAEMAQPFTEKRTDGSGLFGYGLGPGATSPTKILGTIIESGPSMVAAGGPSVAAARGLIGLGMKAGVAGIVGSGLGEGVIGGLYAAKEGEDQMLEAPDDVLRQHPDYRQAFASLPADMPEAERHAAAKASVARGEALRSGLLVGGTTALLGAPSGHFLGKSIGGETGKTLARTIGKQAGLEAVQEASQSAVEKIIHNDAARRYINPNQDMFEGVVEEAASGAITGGVMGGGLGGLSHNRQALQYRQDFQSETVKALKDGSVAGLADDDLGRAFQIADGLYRENPDEGLQQVLLGLNAEQLRRQGAERGFPLNEFLADDEAARAAAAQPAAQPQDVDAPTPEAEASPAGPDRGAELTALSKRQLNDLAASLGVEKPGRIKRDELVASVLQAEEQARRWNDPEAVDARYREAHAAPFPGRVDGFLDGVAPVGEAQKPLLQDAFLETPEPAPATPDRAAELSGLAYSELRDMATSLGVEKPGRLRRDALVPAIVAAEEQARQFYDPANLDARYQETHAASFPGQLDGFLDGVAPVGQPQPAEDRASRKRQPKAVAQPQAQTGEAIPAGPTTVQEAAAPQPSQPANAMGEIPLVAKEAAPESVQTPEPVAPPQSRPAMAEQPPAGVLPTGEIPLVEVGETLAGDGAGQPQSERQEAQAPPAAEDLKARSKRELNDLAASLGIERPVGIRRDDLVGRIEQARQETAGPASEQPKYVVTREEDTASVPIQTHKGPHLIVNSEVPVTGKGLRYDIPALSDVDFIVHPEVGNAQGYSVTEKTTGLMAGRGATEQEAIAVAHDALLVADHAKVLAAIQNKKEENARLAAKKAAGEALVSEATAKPEAAVAMPEASPETAPANAPETLRYAMSLRETIHAKKGHPLFVVTLDERTSREEYSRLKTEFSKLGGYYSKYRGKGAIPGVQFTDKAKAEAFMERFGKQNATPENAPVKPAVARESGALPKSAGQSTDSAARKPLGVNHAGLEVFQDEQGNRYVVEGGVRLEAPVPVRPTRAGVVAEPRSAEQLHQDGETDFLTREEVAGFAEKKAAAASTTTQEAPILGEQQTAREARHVDDAEADGGDVGSGPEGPRSPDVSGDGGQRGTEALPEGEGGNDQRRGRASEFEHADSAGSDRTGTDPGRREQAADSLEGRPGGRDSRSALRRRGDDGSRRSGGVNYIAPEGALTREGSWKATAERNLDILDLVKRLDAEQRQATPEEQALLAKWTGWGASELAQNLFPVDRYNKGRIDPTMARPEWRALVSRALALLSPEELRTAMRSTQYAHYTSEKVIRSIWAGLERLGFTRGKVLEPGMGVGLFPIAAPETVADNIHYVGIEMDGMTAAIARQLLPQASVVHGDFVQHKLPRDFFDLAIGNPPFSRNTVLTDPEYRKRRFLLHDYFFAKSLDRVRPGGLLVFVTSKGTMDKGSDKARQYLGDRADLLGAVRLPQTAFKHNAGTEVVTDVLFLRKREDGQSAGGEPWMGLAEVDTPEGKALVNEYFAAHPEMVLGRHSLKGSMYGGEKEYTVMPLDGDLEAHFREAVSRLPEGVYSEAPAAGEEVSTHRTIERDFNPTTRKEGALYLDDAGEVRRVEDGAGVAIAELAGLAPDKAAWVKGFTQLKQLVRQAQYDQLNDGDWEGSLKALNKAYDAFVREHGPIKAFSEHERTTKNDAGEDVTQTYRRFKNGPLSKLDYEGSVVESLEIVTPEGKIIKSPFLLDRTIRKPARPEINGPKDAFFVSLNDRGVVDLDHVAGLAGQPRAEVIEALGDLIYEAPGGKWQTGDEYLSGDVVAKLAEAETAAAGEPRFERNVKALLAVQPKPLAPDEITVGLGSPWVPENVVRDFARETLGFQGWIGYNADAGVWTVEGEGSRYSGQPSDWNTARRSVATLLSAALNNRSVILKDKDADGKVFTDNEGTAAAQDVVKRMTDAFGSWVWTDGRRAEELTGLYNRRFNNLAPRKFDGSHLTLPGLSLKYRLYDHQKRAIWRVIQTGNTYLAHAVGGGKTLEMIVSAMEQRRLGLINRPMFVVPNHMLQQFASEFLDAYPLANIMVADEKNFHTDNRRRFMAQASLNDPDAIIVTHSSFGTIAVREESLQEVVDDYLEQLDAALEEADDDDRITRKKLEKRKEYFENKILGKAAKARKDNVITFEDMGVDFLYVDEAHEFRKLDFVTNRANVKGIDAAGSAKALDLYVKTLFLSRQKPGRSHAFASGTPVVNTMAELFSIMRFMDPASLERDGLEHFDAWASMFGQVAAGVEQNAAGVYETVERFSKFVNMPELMKRVRSFMDVLTSSQLSGLVKRPELSNGGLPTNEVVQASPELADYLKKVLQPRIETSRKWKPSKDQPGNPDPLINIITDGRLAAIDLRFAGSSVNDPDSKLNRMLDKIIAAYKATRTIPYGEGERPGAAQIVFSAVGFGQQVRDSRGFDVRAYITDRLRKGGIKPSQVAWMEDYTSHAKKEAMFKEMRDGRKLVLFGSPKNMGTGLNVQKRLKALHYLSPPWFPADIEQPHGRILRQGNMNPEVDIHWYATKGTYDSTQWGMLARKQRFIDQAFTGDESVRKLEDISEVSQFEMASALSAGDERAITLAKQRGEVERLKRLKDAHFRDQRRFREETRSLGSAVGTSEKKLAALSAAAETLEKEPVASADFYVDGESGRVSGVKDAGEALLQAARSALDSWEPRSREDENTFSLGKRLGRHHVLMAVSAHVRDGKLVKDIDSIVVRLAKGADVALFGDGFAGVDLGEIAPMTMGSRVRNVDATVSSQIRKLSNTLQESRERKENLDRRIGAKFPYETELAEAVADVARLEKELQAGGAQAAEDGQEGESGGKEADNTVRLARADARAANASPVARAVAAELRQGLSQFQALRGIVDIYQSESDMPADLRQAVEDAGVSGRFHGAYDAETKRIALVAGNIPTVKAGQTAFVQTLLRHEGRHAGLDRVLGGSQERENYMAKAAQAMPREVARWLTRHGLDSTRETRAEAAEEILVSWAKDGTVHRVLDRLLSRIAAWVRAIFPTLELTRAELRQLLAQADDFVDGKGLDFIAPLGQPLNAAPAFARGEARFARAGDLAGVPEEKERVGTWLKDEATAQARSVLAGVRGLSETGVLGRILRSPEYWRHTVLKRLYETFRDRTDRAHELLHQAFDLGDGRTIIQEAKDVLKDQRQRAILNEGVDHADVNEIGPEAMETWFAEHGANEATIGLWRTMRERYDMLLDERLASYRKLMDKARSGYERKIVRRLIDAGIPADAAKTFEAATYNAGKTLADELAPYADEVRDVVAAARKAGVSIKGQLSDVRLTDENGTSFSFAEMVERMGQLRGFYAPRLREAGDYVVRGERIGADGEVERFRAHKEWRSGAEKLRTTMARAGWDMEPVGKLDKLPEATQGLIKTLELAKTVESAVNQVGEDVDAGLVGEILENLADEVKARGFRSQSIRRSGRHGDVVQGYFKDAVERFARYAGSTAYGLAKMEAAEKAAKVLFGTAEAPGIDIRKERDVYRLAVDYLAENLRNAESGDRVFALAKSVASLKYLGGNPRSALVNLSSMATSVPAALHAYAMRGQGGWARVGREIARSMGDYLGVMTGKWGRFTAEEKQFLAEIRRESLDDPQFAREALSVYRDTAGKGWSWLMGKSMALFGATEQLNRGSTLLAGYRLARAAGADHATAVARARETSDRAHGVYDRATQPAWTWGTSAGSRLGQAWYVYKKYGHNYLQLVHELWADKGDRQAALFALAAPAVLGGLGGHVLTSLVKALVAVGGGDDDPEKWVYDVLRRNVGGEAENLARFGLLGLATGTDMSGSLGTMIDMPGAWSDVLGPMGGLAKDVLAGIGYFAGGQPGRAAEKLLPTGVSKILQAVREAGQGVTTSKNYPVIGEDGKPLKPTVGESVAKGLGFRPMREALARSRTSEAIAEEKRYADRRDALYARFRAFALDGGEDAGERQTIVTAVADYNQDVADAGLAGRVSPITREALLRQTERLERPTRREKARLGDGPALARPIEAVTEGDVGDLSHPYYGLRRTYLDAKSRYDALRDAGDHEGAMALRSETRLPRLRALVGRVQAVHEAMSELRRSRLGPDVKARRMEILREREKREMDRAARTFEATNQSEAANG